MSFFKTLSNVALFSAASLVSCAPAHASSNTSLPIIDHNTSFGFLANPYDSAVGFIVPDFVAEVDSSVHKDGSIAKQAEIVKKQSTAIWIASVQNLDKARRFLPMAKNQAASSKEPLVVTLVVYDLPGRDCSAGASVGEFPPGDVWSYRTRYVDPLASLIRENNHPNLRYALIMEPDSLPNLVTNNNIPSCASAHDGYLNGIGYSIATLSAIPNTYIYMDAGNGGWLGWQASFRTEYANLVAKSLSIARSINKDAAVTGFAVSVSNYDPFDAHHISPSTLDCPSPIGPSGCAGNVCIDASSYINTLSPSLAAQGLPTRFVVDTSRAGQAGIREHWSSWCNLKKAGLGPRPVASPAHNVDAFAWIKTPGESDGNSNPGQPGYDPTCDATKRPNDAWANAPQAGDWFHDQFVGLVHNANPPLL